MSTKPTQSEETPIEKDESPTYATTQPDTMTSPPKATKPDEAEISAEECQAISAIAKFNFDVEEYLIDDLLAKLENEEIEGSKPDGDD
ncbi:hypothetical protein V6N13_115956 [Hibiscus sabdariffa]